MANRLPDLVSLKLIAKRLNSCRCYRSSWVKLATLIRISVIKRTSLVALLGLKGLSDTLEEMQVLTLYFHASH